MRLSLEDCDVEKDIFGFIKESGTGQEIPDPPKFINFCRGDAETSSIASEEDENYSVAQFARTLNPAYRASSPAPSKFSSHNDPNNPLVRELGLPQSTRPIAPDDIMLPQPSLDNARQSPRQSIDMPRQSVESFRQSKDSFRQSVDSFRQPIEPPPPLMDEPQQRMDSPRQRHESPRPRMESRRQSVESTRQRAQSRPRADSRHAESIHQVDPRYQQVEPLRQRAEQPRQQVQPPRPRSVLRA